MDSRKTYSKPHYNKFSKDNDKEKIIKAARGSKSSYTRILNKIMSRNLKARKVWDDIVKDLKGKTLQLSILYLTRISFRI